ncbi:MAG: ABC transporter permease [Verrucomicrobia bacterium]|jgi:putative ABC transport system permease protein|nr:ABC transporter permease [Verrucomicrobiota bacterium]MBT7067639.1 ABC transporter permease [Verrucomicrobiota bacterium]
MTRLLLLTWRYMAFNKIKSAIMVVCLTITLFLPIAVHVMIRHYEDDLMARAESTPLIVGAKGNRYDLVLKSLYFTTENPESITMAEVNAVNDSGRAQTIPLHISFTARQRPIVGTSLDYFEFRGLDVVAGTLPLQLGDVVLGHDVARTLNLGVGDTILTDQTSLYDIGAVYPLKMHITGVLAAAGSPDDHAVFVDIKTAWIVEGIGHGHIDLTKTEDAAIILSRKDGEVVGNAAMVEYTEITAANIASFHFHGGMDDFPVTSVIVLPDSAKSATVLKGRYSISPTEQMLVPLRVIEELMGIVFQVKRFFDANFALICLATALFMSLVVMLSLRIRKREMETMFRIGCSRLTVFRLQVAELCIVLLVSLAIAGVLSGLLHWYAPQLVSVM